MVATAPSNKAFLCFQAVSEVSRNFVADPVVSDKSSVNYDNQHDDD